MIPTHFLNDLGPDDRVAILTRNGGLVFHVHPEADTSAAVERLASRDGARVLASHLSDPEAIQALVAAQEPDVGGEG
jgi:hypothetical protein